MALELIIGSMYSGKSTELMRRVARLKSIGMNCLVINHTNDTRVDGDYVQSHDGKKVAAIKTDDLLLTNVRPYDAIAIDEAQFFHNLKTAVMIMVETNNKHVIVAGLSGDYERKAFGEILELVPLADDVHFKRALCAKCCHPGRPASFTKRLSEEKDLVSVGGTYLAVCRLCFSKSFM
jgi:thymidine kinase